MDWTIATDHVNMPDKEGWYLTLFKARSGEIFPLPLYFQFAWNMPGDFDGTIEYFTAITNLPLELVSGKIF